MLCHIFGHRRSRRRAYLEKDHWKSYCKHCGAPMVRVHKGDWKLFTPA